jgi:hypothetical protein
MSRNDEGATRVSDLGRNLLVASTGMIGLPQAKFKAEGILCS